MKNSTSARSPLSPTLWPADAFIWWRSLLFAVGAVVASLAFAIVFGLAWSALYGLKELQHPSLTLTLALQVASYLPILIVAIVVLPALAKRSLPELGLRTPTISEIGIGLAGSLAMFLVSGAIGALEEHVFHVKVQEQAVDLLKSVHGWSALGFAVIACVVAPLVEELAFRGFLLNALLRYVPVPVAAIVSALLFGAAHGSWSALLPLAGVGVVLALVYYRTGALSASMIAHAGFNLIAVVGTFFFKS